MASETDCLNDALGQIGASRITAIDDGSVNANHCLAFYPALRDGLLRSHHWNFAISRVELAQDASPPVSGFAYAYTLPTDCLKVIDYAGGNPTSPTVLWESRYAPFPGPRYKIEGRKLLTDDGQVFLAYIRRETNPDIWDPLFYQAVTTWLASKLADAIPKDHAKANELLKRAEAILMPIALAVDGQEGTPDPLIVDDLLWGR